MLKVYEIKQLEELMKPYLGPNNIVVNYETKPLTSGGENYGSLILAVAVTVRNTITSEHKVIQAVAKMCPPSQIMKEMFNVEVTVRKEIFMYTTVLKELQSFLKEKGVKERLDFLCQFYGSRLSLDPNSTTVDDDAVILMENLKYSGFEMGNRFTGFDFETAKVILRDLAVFHAVPLAYKLQKPQQFEEKFMLLLRPPFDEEKPPPFDEEMLQKAMEKTVLSAIEGDPKCAELKPKLLKLLNTKPRFFDCASVSEPFATFCHQDLWVNNIMIKHENGKPVKAKFVDFQAYHHGFFAKDLFFFLCSSIQVPLLKRYYYDFVEMYREKFVETLESVGCDTGIYTLERINKEMAEAAKSGEMGHVIFMLTPMLAEKGTVDDISEIKPEHLFKLEGTDRYKKRLAEVVLMFNEKQWL